MKIQGKLIKKYMIIEIHIPLSETIESRYVLEFRYFSLYFRDNEVHILYINTSARSGALKSSNTLYFCLKT